jgi:hypothetical protein
MGIVEEKRYLEKHYFLGIDSDNQAAFLSSFPETSVKTSDIRNCYLLHMRSFYANALYSC